jgi:DNA-binding transcriptional ArsR family regulator
MVSNQSKRSDAVFKAIADPTRRRIMGLLRGGEPTVGEIAAHFRTSRPAISKHIRQLRRAGLIVVRKRGTRRICALNAKPLRVIDHFIKDYEAFWCEQLAGLKQFVEGPK